MFRIDGIVEGAEKAACRTVDLEDKTKQQMMAKYVNNIQSSKEKQRKIYEMLTTTESESIDEIGTILQVIVSEYERDTTVKGNVHYLLAIMLSGLGKSSALWKRIVRLIATRNAYKQYLDRVINIECIYEKVISLIDRYFKSLVQMGDTFLIDAASLPEECKHLQSTKLSEILVLLNYLLNHDLVGGATSETFLSERSDLSPEFKHFLRSSMKVIDM